MRARPRSDRVAVRREPFDKVLAWGFVFPARELELAYTGTVVASGPGRAVAGRNLPMDVAIGDRIIYSKRIDSYQVETGEYVDIVEENSVLGKLQ